MSKSLESKRKPTLDELIANAEGRRGKGLPKKPSNNGNPPNERCPGGEVKKEEEEICL